MAHPNAHMKTCDLFKALADETRLRILVMLTEEELCVGELVTILKLSQSNVSRHLAKLLAAGLVSTRRAAQHIYYRLDPHVATTWPDIHSLLLNLKIHPEYEMDFASFVYYRQFGKAGDHPQDTPTEFSVDDLI